MWRLGTFPFENAGLSMVMRSISMEVWTMTSASMLVPEDSERVNGP